MSNTKIDRSSLAPLTFKIPFAMLDKMNEMIKDGEYSTKADLIRDAIQKLIDNELDLTSTKD